MISDIISEALDEIDRYTTDPVLARAYAAPETQAKIAAARAAMLDLLRHLDTPPPSETTLCHATLERPDLYDTTLICLRPAGHLGDCNTAPDGTGGAWERP